MIHPCVLKDCAHDLAYPLFRMFRKSLDEGNVPNYWKSGNVTPIYKKGSRTSVDNYRPVSLTSVICKVMERLLRKQCYWTICFIMTSSLIVSMALSPADLVPHS